MRTLPEEFAELAPFVASWALATEPERWSRRHASTLDEMKRFYEAVLPRYEEILAYVDRFPLDELPEEAGVLLELAMSFVMVSFPVEVWGGPGIPDSGNATLHRVVSPVF